MKSKIDFYCIGAQKAATSWLYERLNELPDFSMPYIKELHFFDRSEKYPSPSKLSRSLISRLLDYDTLSTSVMEVSSSLYRMNFKKMRWMLNWHFSKIHDDWYLSLFENLNRISGDMTPAYSILDVVDIKKMYELSPDAKIILILRNPIERAISHLKFYHQSRGILINNLSIDKIKCFLDSDNQVLRSDYLRTLNNYSEVYKSSNILVGFYDAIIDHPNIFLAEVVDFLGGKKNQIQPLKLNRKINVSKKEVINQEILNYITEKYANNINNLSKIFGGYCSLWKNRLDNNKHFQKTYLTITLDKIDLTK